MWDSLCYACEGASIFLYITTNLETADTLRQPLADDQEFIVLLINNL